MSGAGFPSGASDCSMLSVVVIGRNEGARLRRCLNSVNTMRRGMWDVEVIYVDSGSRDGSVALAKGLGARVIALQAERPTAAMGRNAGWRAARGQRVLFLDGDTVLAENFFVEAMASFADATVAAVWGHRREMYPERSVYQRVMDLDWIYAPGVTPFCGGDVLFRREVLERVGGFDETLIAGEEPELCRRVIVAGFSILHIDRAMTLHDLAIDSFGAYWKRAVRAGHAYAEVAARFAGTEGAFWSDEVRRNRMRVMGFVGLVAAGLVVSAATRSVWGLVGAGCLLAGLVLRTAWKARWKSGDWGTLVLYGVHSHWQQVPIFWGQMRFAMGERRGRAMGLVEYKRS